MRHPARMPAIGRVSVWVATFLWVLTAGAIDASDRYRSPRNPERGIRKSTELIVLHTTEAPAKSSLNKVSDRGECHFCVTEAGAVYRIVDRDREAFHAGRSMWNGREDVDKFSVGIECVGYHNKPMGWAQINAIRTLVKELQAMYSIPDHCVVAHSHVAYGVPNKWQKRRHRGRKRCGMLFAMPSNRQRLNLKTRPAYDPDVRAGRLAIGDPYLNQVLYGKVDTMAPQKPSSPAPKKPVTPAKPVTKTTVKPVVKPVSKSVVKPVAKTVAKPAVKAAVKSATKKQKKK